jgi:hypothetical protein
MRPLFIGILLGLLLAAVTTIAIAADSPPGLNAGAWAASQAAAASSAGAAVKTAQTAAQQVAVTVNQPAPAASGGGGKTTTLRTVPDAYAPTMNATAPCRISVSAGVAVIGIGVSGGGSVEDDPCNLRETARLLDGIGQREAAARVMCNDRRAAEALGESICPSIGDRERSTSPLQSQATTGRGQPICDQAARFDDPILAARNGCAGW